MTKNGPSELFAFYDLEVSLATFDVTTFLLLAEMARQKLNLERINFIVVPSAKHVARVNDDYQDLQQSKWRIGNIVLPATTLMPSVSEITVCAVRDQARQILARSGGAVFPENYSVDDPVHGWDLATLVTSAAAGNPIPSLSAGKQAVSYVRQWIDNHAGGKKVVAITLREASYNTHRNSIVESWTEFARELDEDEYFPVILRDTEALVEVPDQRFEGLNLFGASTVNLELRMALYECAYINMFTSNGTAQLCWFSGTARYLFFNAGPTNDPRQDKEPQAVNGIPYGSTPAFATPYQKWVWEMDEVNVLRREFRDLAKVLDANPGPAFTRQPLARKDLTLDDKVSILRMLVENGREGVYYDYIMSLSGVTPDQLADIGDSLFRRGKWELAGAAFEKIDQQVPGDFTYTIRFGDLFARENMTAEAIQQYQRAKNLGGPKAQLYVRIGDMRARQGNLEDAIADYRKSLDIDENSEAGLIRMGMLMDQTGNVEESIMWLNKALTAGTSEPVVYDILDRLYRQQGGMAEIAELMTLRHERGI